MRTAATIGMRWSYAARHQGSSSSLYWVTQSVPGRGSASPLFALQTSCCSVHIEHSSDIHKWRNPEKAEVRRHFRNGVKLGSHIVKIREQEAREKELIEQDKFTNWKMVYNYALGSALLLIGLNLMMVFVEPNPSPVYVPYSDASLDHTTNSSPR